MDKKKTKVILDSLLRGGLCACWLTGIPLSIMFYIIGTSTDDTGEYTLYITKALICFGVTVLGACAHGFMLNIRDEEDANG